LGGVGGLAFSVKLHITTTPVCRHTALVWKIGVGRRTIIRSGVAGVAGLAMSVSGGLRFGAGRPMNWCVTVAAEPDR
jgi:hypothetical protein